jgi:hypothetical protein
MPVSPPASEPLAALLTPQGLELLSQHEPGEASNDEAAMRLTLALRKAGHAPELTAAVVHQLGLRHKGEAKFGPFAREMFLTRPGLEQATRLPVAALHARRFAQAGVDHVADLGCGIGADSLALASLDLAVTSVEADETTAAVATLNLMPFPRSRVVHGFAEEASLEGIDGVWLDPARRDEESSGTRRLFDPEAFTPPLSFVTSLAARGLAVGVKLGPALPHDAVPEGVEAQWLSDRGDVVEATLWFNALARPGVLRAAAVMGQAGLVELTADTGFPGIDPEAARLEGSGLPAPGEYLHEPDGAVIRAGLVADLAERLGAQALDPHLAYLRSATPSPDALATSYRVIGELPLKTKALRAWAKSNQVTTLTIKKRGVDIDPAQLRREIFAGRGKLKGGRAATLILARVGERRVALEVEPVT